MGGPVAAYFDLDGTLLNASSEKTLTAHLARRRPWRIPWGTVAWTAGFLSNLLRGRAVYDAARNRGHLSLASWEVLERYSSQLAEHRLKASVPPQAWEKLAYATYQRDLVLGLTRVDSTLSAPSQRMYSGSAPCATQEY